MAIPALSRGLTILELLIKHPRGLRYTELKESLDGVGDASMGRLLTALTESGFAVKQYNRYFASERVRSWLSWDKNAVAVFIHKTVDAVADESGESAAFALYEGEQIRIAYSRNCQDSINIIPAGDTLHFEDDHAASLAVLGLLSEKERERALASPFSRSSIEAWKEGQRCFYRDGYYADRSKQRRGISRIAVPWSDGQRRGALFLCLPTERLIKSEKRLAELIKKTLDIAETSS